MDLKLQFEVDASKSKEWDQVEKVLRSISKDVKIDRESQTVAVVTETSVQAAQELLEQTGRRAVLKGVSGSLGNAVCEMFGTASIRGVVRFVQTDGSTCIVDGTIDGLSPGLHGFHVHELGDLSGGCDSVGEHYNPTSSQHGGPKDLHRHVGDLGNITADVAGRASFRFSDLIIKVDDIIGRSLVVTSHQDDFGRGENENSKVDGNSGSRLACGVIARSAGLFQNPKKICDCSGRTLWEERDIAKKYT